MTLTTLAMLLSGVVLAAPAPPGRALSAKEVGALFDTQRAALEAKDEGAFRATWHGAGYAENLVGGSGLAGERVFAQGSRKGWHLRPELATLAAAGRADVAVVRCDVWSPGKARAVDEIFALVVRDDAGRAVMLGGGEDRAEVAALAARFLAGKPLAPPASE